ncbi:uncharacterized protein LOC133149871 isoform X1 [Syngnathus typhle]|uniref:uncharacterized protein LOC133149871 isoform X1 n=1 Tax=Syngnathus typhle TaxID=161592 RepID=UPI002A6B19B2|nr:uncharacterized protein LOC133149871 isoform X1 [Syngnathus typhle]
MESTTDSQQRESSARPKRDPRPPAHLDPYEVTLLPSQQPVAQASSTPVGQLGQVLSTRARSLTSYRSAAHSRRSSQMSNGLSLLQSTSDIQAAALEEEIKGLELADLQQEIEEERKADLEAAALDAQAREGQRLQEEAHLAKERLAKEMGRRRRLKKLEKEVQIASLVKTYLSETNDDALSTSSAPATFSKPSLRSQPPRVPFVLTQHPPVQPPPPAPVQIPPPATVPGQIVAPPANLITSAQASVPVSAPPIAATVAAFPPGRVSSSPVLPTVTSHAVGTLPITSPPSQYPGVSATSTSFTTTPLATSVMPPPPTMPFAQPITPTATPVPAAPPWTYPGMETLIATSYGIPKPTLPFFESGKESDFALLKMALDNLMNSHTHLSEHYKYQVLLGQLKLPSALQLAKSYMYDPAPYTAAVGALQDKYGQPRQLVQSELGAILNSPAIKFGDADAFDSFALSVQSLVGMLRTLEGPVGYELRCGSHVDRLLSKLSPSQRDGFVEYCLVRGILQPGSELTYSLPDFAAWLQMKAQAKRLASRATLLYNSTGPSTPKREQFRSKPRDKTASVFLCTRETATKETPQPKPQAFKLSPYCPFCNNKEHYLNSCLDFKKLSPAEIKKWIQEGDRCWRCGRAHKATACTLKRPCKTCKEKHLTVLHDAIQESSQTVLLVSNPAPTIYIEQPRSPQRVLLKVVKVLLHHGDRVLETFAVLDDGSERTIILPQAVEQLQLSQHPETLHLRTVQQEVKELKGSCVSVHVSPVFKPNQKFCIRHAFTADSLSLSEHTYPVAALQKRYEHLKGLPLTPIHRAQPLLLIGSDMAHLLSPTQPVRSGPSGSPMAVCTRLGWSLQGPSDIIPVASHQPYCFHIATESPYTELIKNVERLWHIDTVPYISEKTATRSKQDQQALTLLQTASERVSIDGTQRYATPLLRRQPAIPLRASPAAVMPNLRCTERRIAKDTARAASYCAEMDKLLQAGYVSEISTEEAETVTESWYVPHHMVHHNGKDRVVFNCSFSFNGLSLNDQLLPGPTLGPTMIGVLMRFRCHAVAISGDIKSMFHQIRLMPKDKPLLRFLWRDMQRTSEPRIYQWEVLPFGTTCSPCCAVFALQQHVRDHEPPDSPLTHVIEQSFYVDNCLHSVSKPEDAKALVDDLRALLRKGGFEIRQWASNVPEVVAHLPPEAQSTSSELWLSKASDNLQEPTLGLCWDCLSDTLSYKHRSNEPPAATLRNVYSVLAKLYDPLGYIVPFTTRCKVLVQDMWKANIGWDDKIQPSELLGKWLSWVQEIPTLQQLKLPRPYSPASGNTVNAARHIHIFCDASERAYGSVAYMQITDDRQQVFVSFVFARSRVAPRKQLSIPRLELSAALTGAQLAKVIETELTVTPEHITLWSDSTTVLHWIKSESCRYKVFVGTRVAEIQNLTSPSQWRYVGSLHNPADDITRGLTLKEMVQDHRWNKGPHFLLLPESEWPIMPSSEAEADTTELRKSAFVGAVSSALPTQHPDLSKFSTWQELLQETASSLHGAANTNTTAKCSATDFLQAEKLMLQKAQEDCFAEELRALKVGRALPVNSHLMSLSPEYDKTTELLRVGGRLRHAEGLDLDTIHPVIMDPSHHVTKLIIKNADDSLLHPGPERVLAELRRRFWIIRGREAIRKHQYSCLECRRWRAKPDVPKMADYPPARLRLYKPPFYSTGVDCFGPFQVRIGRRTEKRWGIVYKCMTTRSVHLDLLESLDTDAFLLSLRRFISRRGRPFELLMDNGTNFVGGERELREAVVAMAPELKDQLAEQQISFRFNPPSAPHFGGTWEREVRSIKSALRVVLRDQTVPESVLMTTLVEVEGILNAKPLGYLSSDASDPDPVTPNLLLMGRHDSSLPQAVYDPSDLGRRRWRHSQFIADRFWASFISHYLPGLQERSKWRKDGKALSIGDVVLIVDPQLPRASWPVGRITLTHPGADGRIRTATVQVKDRIYVRPVARLILLPAVDDKDEEGTTK